VEPSALYKDVVAISAQTGTCVLRESASVECFAPGGPREIAGLEEGVLAVNGQCAVTNLGGVKCWVENGEVAQVIPGLESGVVAIATASYFLDYYHACALTEIGGVKCWGKNAFGYGECGNGMIVCSATPTDVVGLTEGVKAIAATQNLSCAFTTSGKVKCWGDDLYRSQGAEICYVGGRSGEIKDYCDLTPVDVPGLPNQVQEIALGGDLCTVATNGDVACTVGGSFTNIDAKGVTVGQAHRCILLASGGVRCWGDNEFGQVGNGILGGQAAVPMEVIGLDAVVTAIDAGSNHTCAVTESGGVRCWGSNNQGQLGINTGLAPVDVLGFGVTDIDRHHLPWLAGKEE
jgi:hypothetical protein